MTRFYTVLNSGNVPNTTYCENSSSLPLGVLYVRMRVRLLGMSLREVVTHYFQRASFPFVTVLRKHFLDTRWNFSTTFCKVPGGNAPIERIRCVGILEKSDSNFCSVAGSDSGLQWFSSHSSGYIDTVDTGPTRGGRLDKLFSFFGDRFDRKFSQIVESPGRRDENSLTSVRPFVRVGRFDDETGLWMSVHVDNFVIDPLTTRPFGLLSHEIEQQTRIDTDRESGEVLQVRVPSQDGLTGVEHGCFQTCASCEATCGPTGDTATNYENVVVAHNRPVRPPIQNNYHESVRGVPSSSTILSFPCEREVTLVFDSDTSTRFPNHPYIRVYCVPPDVSVADA